MTTRSDLVELEPGRLVPPDVVIELARLVDAGELSKTEARAALAAEAQQERNHR